jgi:hypothetical protein
MQLAPTASPLTPTVQNRILHYVCMRLTNAFQVKPLKSKQESGVNMLILTFSYFQRLFQFSGSILVPRCPCRTANRDVINEN